MPARMAILALVCLALVVHPLLYEPSQVSAQESSTATTIDRLNLRAGPGVTYAVRSVIPLGETVQLTGQDSNGFRSVTWNSVSGWVFATWISIDEPTPSPNATATTTDRLNLRSGPGTGYGVVVILNSGVELTLTGQTTNGFRSVTWQSYSGWVSGEWLNLASEPEPPVVVPDPVATTTDNVNLRSGPGTTFGVIRVVPIRTDVVVTGSVSNGFRPVSVSGTAGWISADYLTDQGSEPQPSGVATTSDRLNLRAAPNTTSAVVVVIPSGGRVTLTGQSSNGFRSVTYGGKSGWAFEAYLIMPSPPKPPAAVPFAVTNTLVGQVRGSAATAIAFAERQGALRMPEVRMLITELYFRAPQIGLDPAILVAQSALETDFWRSSWWVNRLNPAGIGVTGDPAQNEASPRFSNGMIAARAQLAHMHAEVFGNSRPLPPVLQGVDPTYQRVFEAGWAGTIVTISNLAGTWAADPLYDVKIVSRAKVIFPNL